MTKRSVSIVMRYLAPDHPTQKQVAEEFGITPQRVGQIIHERVSEETLALEKRRRISRASKAVWNAKPHD